MCVAIAQRGLETKFESLASLRNLLQVLEIRMDDDKLNFDNLSEDQQKLAALVINTWNRDNPGLLPTNENEEAPGNGRRTSRVTLLHNHYFRGLSLRLESWPALRSS